MIEIHDTSPDTAVLPAEYARLLGYPRGHVMSGRPLELAAWAREWYAANGRPWLFAREAAAITLNGSTVWVEGAAFSSRRMASTLERADAHAAILVAVSAGPELEREARRLWQEQRPDEYFFLEIFGSAVVEHLTTAAGARLCGWAEAQQMAVLPHQSPGYADWDIGEQARLLDLMRPTLPGGLGVLESGMLQPKKSQLALFGLTRNTERLQRLTDLVPCENCSLGGCAYRRARYRLAPDVHTVNQKALRRWAAERVSLQQAGGGGVLARFRYDGTTCSNMGRALAFEYEVTLGPAGAGYIIREQRCAPVASDTGHPHMCKYIEDGAALMAAIADEKPLLGHPLRDALTWQRAGAGAGCYCTREARDHKWGLALETIHFALAQKEKDQ